MTASRICGLVCVVVAVVAAGGTSAVKLPNGFIQCKYNSPKIDECLKDAVQKALPHLANGVPSLGIPQIDPLKISSLQINQGSGPVNIKLSFKDISISSIRTAVIDYVHYDDLKTLLSIELHPTKPIVIDGDYEMNGKVLVLPVVGKGKCKISLEVSKVVGSIQLKKSVAKNGNTYLEIVKIDWKFIPTKLSMKFENLFNGDKALGDNMNVFLNENWREVLVELQPAIEEVFAVAFTGLGHQFLNRVPLNQILNYSD